tara:strand:+ start:816 stop:1475 length:660 start_codon:yes stop_codon:yes gene_type:complete
MSKRKKQIKIEDDEQADVERPQEPEEESGSSTIIFDGLPDVSTKIISLYGDVSEERCAELVNALFILRELYKTQDEDSEEESEPIEMLISTHGGNTTDMFAIYDMMNLIKKDHEIATIGLGKVMSAGVLLLAAGTKGKRKVGSHCRLMLHGVSAGHVGEIHNLKNELEEAQWMQDQYVECLSKDTKMTKKQIKKLIDKQINTYFDAKEAIKYGIADEII